MTKHLIAVLFPFLCFAQSENLMGLLTGETWNITYSISPDGERKDETDSERIRSNWVKFYPDGVFETPGGMAGKTRGTWEYKPEENAIYFKEKGSSYRAVIEELSELSLVLEYVDHGGSKIGMTHYIHVPKTKTKEQAFEVLTSGRWLVLIKRFEGFEDPTLPENVENTWYEFLEDGSYRSSDVIGEEPVVNEGYWFLDEKVLLNLDAGENTIYSVIGDDKRLILTTTTGGYNTIEMKKAISD